MWGFLLKSATFFNHAESEETAFVWGQHVHNEWKRLKCTVCIMNLIYAGKGRPGSTRSKHSHCANEKETRLRPPGWITYKFTHSLRIEIQILHRLAL